MKILTIVGARPQFVKSAVVSAAIARTNGITERIVHTGQHFDANMSDVFFQELGIPQPAHTLDIHSLSHGAMTGRMLEQIEALMLKEQPDWTLVYGDTNSTLAGALAAVKLHIPVAHIEAGLRSFNRKMPEEINRIATDHVSSLLFAPTDAAIANLNKEGITGGKVMRTGDVMYDCSLQFSDIARRRSTIFDSVPVQGQPFVLCTAHRAENTDDPALMNTLFATLIKIASQIPVVFPVHPRTIGLARDQGLDLSKTDGLHLIEPIGYLDMLRLEQEAAVIMTDSGGVQKEAYFLKVPCVTLRQQTEWIELVDSGWNTLCPLQMGEKALVSAVLSAPGKRGEDGQLYGDGKASDAIVRRLTSLTGQ